MSALPRPAALAPPLALALALALVGSITFTYQTASPTIDVRTAEIAFGKLGAGTSAGTNSTAGTGSVSGGLLASTTNLLYLNNTNASSAWFAKLTVTSSSGVSNLVALTIGIDNGTLQPQILVAGGSLTQSAGSYIRLETSSTNKLYLTESVTTPGSASSITFTVTVADDTGESAYVNTTATFNVT